MSTDNVCVHLLSDDQSRLVCQSVSSGFRATRLAHGLDVSSALAATQAVHERRTVCVDNASTDPRVARVARERHGIGACMYVPLIVRGEATGVSIFSFQQAHGWTPTKWRRGSATLGDVLKHHLSRHGMKVRRYSSVAEARAALEADLPWATALLADIALDEAA